LTDPAPLALDCDGVILDPRPRQVAVAAAVLEELGQGPLDGKAFWRAKRAGGSTEEALVEIGYSSDSAREAASRWPAHIEDARWINLDRPLPGTIRALALLRERSPLLIASARQHPERMVSSIEGLGIAGYFEEIVVVSPNAASEEKAAALEKLACWGMVGDSPSDAEAAERARVPFWALASGQRSAGYLRSHGYQVHESLIAAVDSLLGAAPQFGSAIR
jgi:phosphoglycolate phosphatase-like HAD superfamily hydrolase